MTIPTVTALPTAPTRADSATFDTRADAFMPALVALATEINATVAATNAATAQVTADAAATAADVVLTHADVVLTHADVVTTAQAVIDVQTVATQIAPAWIADTEYDYPEIVAATDGLTYRALSPTTGNNPVTDGGVHWAAVNGLPAITSGDAGKSLLVNGAGTGYQVASLLPQLHATAILF